PLLRAIAREPDFALGTTTTAYLETHDLSEAAVVPQAPHEALIAAALYEVLDTPRRTTPSDHPYNPWTRGVAQGALGGEWHFRYGGSGGEHGVRVRPAGDGAGYLVDVDGAAYAANRGPISASVSAEDCVAVRAGAVRWRCWVARRDYELLVFYQG